MIRDTSHSIIHRICSLSITEYLSSYMFEIIDCFEMREGSFSYSGHTSEGIVGVCESASVRSDECHPLSTSIISRTNSLPSIGLTREITEGIIGEAYFFPKRISRCYKATEGIIGECLIRYTSHSWSESIITSYDAREGIIGVSRK